MKELVRVILSDRMNPKGRTMCQKKKANEDHMGRPCLQEGNLFGSLIVQLCGCEVSLLFNLLLHYQHHVLSPHLKLNTHTHRASNVSHEIIRSVQGKVKKMWEKWASKNKM